LNNVNILVADGFIGADIDSALGKNMGCGFAEFNAEIIIFCANGLLAEPAKTVMIPLVEFIILRSSPSSKYFAIVIIADKPRAFNESSEQNESIFG